MRPQQAALHRHPHLRRQRLCYSIYGLLWQIIRKALKKQILKKDFQDYFLNTNPKTDDSDANDDADDGWTSLNLLLLHWSFI